MANTIVNTRLVLGRRRVVQYITLVSDGDEESNLVVYDSDVVATALGIPDPLTCTILKVHATVSAANAARIKLEFVATADTLALDLPTDSYIDGDFTSYGGLANTAGTGVTGDIALTTTGLGAGDLITIILEVRPD